MCAHIVPRAADGRVSRSRFSLSGLFRSLMFACARRRDRKRLATLDDHLLQDIGLSRAEAVQEAKRKEWDAPECWIR